MNQRTLRIATRTSPLALWQANLIADLIRACENAPLIELVPVVTSGDTNQTDALRQFGGTGVFTREVQRAVLEERADLAVHSLKDLPTQSADHLVLAGIPPRAPRFDAILLANGEPLNSLSDLPQNARIGTGSPRRQAQLLYLRPDLKMQEIRGNLDTRLRKLDEGQYDAIVLAEAGLMRLGLESRISLTMQPPQLYPAVGQGVIGVECRTTDEETREYLAAVSCPQTIAEALAERALLRTLRAGCHAPLGVRSEVSGDVIRVTGVLLSHDGQTRLELSSEGFADSPEAVGIAVADRLFEAGAEQLLTQESDRNP